jgi:pimeloyl-ACP methyl ester carboxylesterase
MTDRSAALEAADYDEFGFLADTVAEWGVPVPPLTPRRTEVETAPGQMLSAIVWGEAPEIVFLHGGGQNAHTWDTVVLALGKSAVAFDAPGHGRSYWREDRDYGPWRNAEAQAAAIEALAPDAKAVVGMSLGGATTIRLAATRPDLVRKAVIIDVTPQVNDPSRQWTRADRGTVALIADSPYYDSFEAMAAAAIALSPNRSAEAVRRGVRHNAKRLDDGRWTWRYDLNRVGRPSSDFMTLWEDVSAIKAPAMLVVGGASKFVLDADAAEMKRRLPGLRVETVAGAGHAVQSDRPLDLVRLIKDFVFNER